MDTLTMPGLLLHECNNEAEVVAKWPLRATPNVVFIDNFWNLVLTIRDVQCVGILKSFPVRIYRVPTASQMLDNVVEDIASQTK